MVQETLNSCGPWRHSRDYYQSINVFWCYFLARFTRNKWNRAPQGLEDTECDYCWEDQERKWYQTHETPNSRLRYTVCTSPYWMCNTRHIRETPWRLGICLVLRIQYESVPTRPIVSSYATNFICQFIQKAYIKSDEVICLKSTLVHSKCHKFGRRPLRWVCCRWPWGTGPHCANIYKGHPAYSQSPSNLEERETKPSPESHTELLLNGAWEWFSTV